MDPVPVLADVGDTDPQAAPGLPVTVKLTVSLATDPPKTAGVSRTVKSWVDVPLPRRFVVPGGDRVTAFVAGTWVTFVDPLCAESASTAVIWQGPGVTVAVRVVVATPDVLVVAVAAESDPQPVPAVKVTGSPGTGVLPESVVTVALMVDEAAALAWMLVGEAVTAIV